MIEINSVKIQGYSYLVNGNTHVPKADGNCHYEMIKKWIDDGNVPEPEFTQEEIEKQEAERLEAKSKAKKAQELSSIVVTTSKGNSFDGNETARLNMLAAIQTSEILGITENYWKLADNSIAVVDVLELKEALALSIQEVGNIVKEY